MFIHLAPEQPQCHSRRSLSSEVTQRKAPSCLFVPVLFARPNIETLSRHCLYPVSGPSQRPPPLLTPVGEPERRSRFYFYELEKGLRLMCFDCSLPLWSSGVLRNTQRGEALKKESCGGDGPRPAGAAAAGDSMANEKKNNKKTVCTLHAEINMIYWMITSSAAPAVARESKWVDPLVLAHSLSVLSKEGARVGVKERHLFKSPSTCKLTARQHQPVSERPIGEASSSSTYSACSTFHTKLLCYVNNPQRQVFAPPTDTTCLVFFFHLLPKQP